MPREEILALRVMYLETTIGLMDSLLQKIELPISKTKDNLIGAFVRRIKLSLMTMDITAEDIYIQS